MNLRTKIPIALAVVFAALGLGHYFVARIILFDSFETLERDQTAADIRRAAAALDARIADIGVTTDDYACWDDVYEFLGGSRPEFPDRDAQPSNADRLRLDLMAYLRSDGSVAHAVAVDLDADEPEAMPPPADLFERLAESPSPTPGRSGIVVLRDGPMMFAQRPSYTSLGLGPSHGWVVFGRFLDDEALGNLSRSTRLPLSLGPAPALPPDSGGTSHAGGDGPEPVIRDLDESTLIASLPIPDIDGRPAFSLEMRVERKIHRQGLRALTYSAAAMAVAAAAMLAILIVLLFRTVLSRLARLSAEVDAVRTSGDATRRVSVPSPRDELGRLGVAINSMLDSLEKTQAELGRRQLTAQEACDRLSMAVEQAEEAMVIADTQSRIQYVNPAFERMTGWTRDEAIGRHPAFLAGARSAPDDLSHQMPNLSSGPIAGPLMIKRKDGTTRDVSARITALRDSSGGVVAYVGVMRDITVERQMESQLRQAHKMEAVGRLAGGVAHDFNNVLAAILGYSELLLAMLPPDSPHRAHVEEIRAAGERAAGLTRQLLTFSRKQVVQTRLLVLNDVVASTRNMLGRLIGEDVELVHRLRDGLWLVRADEGQIEQVVINLTVNARDAMPKGGRIQVVTDNVTLAERRGAIGAGDWVTLEVVDDGVGMTPDVQSRLFEPFFTTKEVGKGTGLGLSTVYGIVQQSGGHIEVDSAPERGSTFRIFLPRAVAAGRVDRKTPSFDPDLYGTETILLVEDEAPVRTLARDLLGRLGYRVLEAGTPTEAIRIAKEQPGAIRLLLADVVMPEMSGPEVADRIAGVQPGLLVLYVSGYPHETLRARGMALDADALVMKPFSGEALARRIRRMIDRS